MNTFASSSADLQNTTTERIDLDLDRDHSSLSNFNESAPFLPSCNINNGNNSINFDLENNNTNSDNTGIDNTRNHDIDAQSNSNLISQDNSNINDIENGTNINNNNNDNDNDSNNNGTINNLRSRMNRQISSIGRHFNILDRLFNKRTIETSQHGASYDGVFSNLTAKPNGLGNEPAEEDIPPTYESAANDMVPSYYGVHTEGSAMYYDEICIEGLPVGNVANLIWNIVVSTSFQFIGFLITYVLHTSHAAKQGSRFGLGLTFIGYCYSMLPNDVTSKVGKDKSIDRIQVEDPNEFDNLQINPQTAQIDNFKSNLSHGWKRKRRKYHF
ncbi:hypothetical protein Kpol_1018p39 [Vanderwaltozyma polyspora DSM 70294]|uniref:Metal homeostatis protein BSD2 n=1 Tax=Vanderwaltozyma polyspora (strain ATCC 22028 / DSM 70294 / BCRC 21397 / CBS 2163 / NBRC 10782 / NRRL Y-8283 / UCD 57-17) TaxID=436907 RepID=A7TDN9_VANPO|nr:uncharacterized protein Kpol_1018p39 [Vanderwaltozyma polyspora DSM 70294]EDO19509.1 hypothetical protein Kpol_1018p39 [Vanderwaltozyma polyspora DSM 70294]